MQNFQSVREGSVPCPESENVIARKFKAKVALEAVKGVKTVQQSRERLSGPSHADHDLEETGNRTGG